MELDDLLKRSTGRPWIAVGGKIAEHRPDGMWLGQFNVRAEAELTTLAVNTIEQVRNALRAADKELTHYIQAGANEDEGQFSGAMEPRAQVRAALAAIEGTS